jgi:uncharacterized protein involved in exopolysaccharide biosynthesis|tara:strand:+ start:175 stop:1338 length:1164 start_codon:yes stop_codon:yes gene_type:complete
MEQSGNVRQIIDELMQKNGYRHFYEVAEHFGVTAQTLSGWLKNNIIPHKHLLTIQNEFASFPVIEENPAGILPKLFSLIREKRKTLLFMSVSIFLASFVYFQFIADPIYTAKASVIPTGDSGGDFSGLTGAAAQIGLSFPVANESIAWDELFFEILRSDGIKRKLLNTEFQLKKSQPAQPLRQLLLNHLDLENKPSEIGEIRINNYLKKRIRVTKTRFSPLIHIQMDAHDPLLASNMINTLVQLSNKMQVDIKTRQMGQKRQFIEERIVEVKKELSQAESGLKNFRERNRRPNKSPSLLLEESRLMRDVTLQNNLYLTLQTQFEEAKIEEVERTPMVEIVDEPVPPLDKTSPRVIMSTILTTFLGIVFIFFIIISKEVMIPLLAILN